MHFYCDKLLVARNWDKEGLNRPPVAEDVKCMGVENLAGGLTPPNLLQSICTRFSQLPYRLKVILLSLLQ